MRLRFGLLAALCLALTGSVLSAQGRIVTKEQVQEITSNLVCLCGCGNKTVSLCGCSTADATTKEVEVMLREGKSAEQIFAHYVSGDAGIAVLAAPPKKGFNLVVWVLPFLGIFIGGMFLLAKIRHWQADLEKGETALVKEKAKAEQAHSDPYRERLNRELERID